MEIENNGVIHQNECKAGSRIENKEQMESCQAPMNMKSETEYCSDTLSKDKLIPFCSVFIAESENDAVLNTVIKQEPCVFEMSPSETNLTLQGKPDLNVHIKREADSPSDFNMELISEFDHEINSKIKPKEEDSWLSTEVKAELEEVADSDLQCSKADDVSRTTELQKLILKEATRLHSEAPYGCERYRANSAVLDNYGKSSFHEDSITETFHLDIDTNMSYFEHSYKGQEGAESDDCILGLKSSHRIAESKEKQNSINLPALKKGMRKYRCKICDKNFARSSALKAHNLIHEGKRMHKCNICQQSFTHASNMRRHSLIHEGKRLFECKICKKSFTRAYALKEHNLIHEGKMLYKCNICEKSFVRASSLKEHNLIHEGKRPYKCNICQQTFTQASNMKRHSLIHEGKRLYECKICNKSFTRASSLKDHNLIHERKMLHVQNL